MNIALILWIISLIVFIIIETATVQLVTIWFAAGSLCALIAEVFDAPVWMQMSIFVVVSALSLIATRPLIKKLRNKPPISTNADSIIGLEAIVTEEIDNIAAKGRVEVNGMSWSARSENNEIFSVGKEVVILKIEGVKLIVK